ncbi:MAG: hypothetical protein COB17_01975 [Sulfurimonas sp.]|nr:MAG: hypothetical protein COB17_01975 [Sulfurimonas sp.]
MNRYLSSFIISFIFFTSIILVIFYFLTNNNFSVTEMEIEKVSKINLSIIFEIQQSRKEPLKNKILEKKTETEPIPEPEILVKAKQITESELIVEPKQITESELIVEPKLIPKKVPSLLSTPKISQKRILKSKKQTVNSNIRQAKQKLFITELVKKINNNKSYPYSARRRCIQGKLDIKFKILANGNVDSIEILSGKRIFKKSAIKAIYKSFPIQVDKSIFDFPKEFTIKMAYLLK